MASRNRPAINITLDGDIHAELLRRKREEALNVSRYVNGVLRPLFPKKRGKK